MHNLSYISGVDWTFPVIAKCFIGLCTVSQPVQRCTACCALLHCQVNGGVIIATAEKPTFSKEHRKVESTNPPLPVHSPLHPQPV